MSAQETLRVEWDEEESKYVLIVRAGTQRRQILLPPNTRFITYMNDDDTIGVLSGGACKHVDMSGEHLLFHGTTYPPYDQWVKTALAS